MARVALPVSVHSPRSSSKFAPSISSFGDETIVDFNAESETSQLITRKINSVFNSPSLFRNDNKSQDKSDLGYPCLDSKQEINFGKEEKRAKKLNPNITRDMEEEIPILHAPQFQNFTAVQMYGRNYKVKVKESGIFYAKLSSKSSQAGEWIKPEEIIGFRVKRISHRETLYIYTIYKNQGGHSCCIGRSVSNSAVKFYTVKWKLKLPETFDTISNQLHALLYENPKIKRPRTVAVLMNPISGKGNAKNIFKQQVEPIFKKAGIRTILLETQKKNHTYELISQLDINLVDVLACVGGDGLFFEAVNAIMKRADYATAAKIPLAILPAGSQNALGVSIGNSSEAVVHALYVVTGRSRPLDVVAVQHNVNRETYYSTCVAAFGYIADVGHEAQKFRWMGPYRYIYCGGKQFLSPKFYNVKISYIPADSVDSTWKTFDESVFCMFACNISCQNSQFPAVAPQADPADGLITLLLFKKCTRLDMISFSINQKTGKHLQMECVDSYKVKALKFEPLSPGGFVNIDGEIFPPSSLELSIMQSYLTVMGGVSLFESSHTKIV